jgi:hypothetical protein
MPVVVPWGRIRRELTITTDLTGMTFYAGQPMPVLNWTGSVTDFPGMLGGLETKDARSANWFESIDPNSPGERRQNRVEEAIFALKRSGARSPPPETEGSVVSTLDSANCGQLSSNLSFPEPDPC